MANIFITGATGFMGRRLSAELVARGHRVRGLVRRGSEKRLAAGCKAITGDPLDAATYRESVAGCDTLVHLVGVAHPSPAKKEQFRSIDLASAIQAVSAAAAAGVRNLVYVSVAHPAPIMRDYIAARTEVEDAIRRSGLNSTILRPWYVLGPGRRWPLALKPVYWVMEALPGTRESARRLGLVTVEQMVASLVHAVLEPPSGVRVWEVPQIRLTRS
jgi:uncharacterized protein YbjT (DUF2867 family)